MYYNFSSSLTQRLVEILQRSFHSHPRYSKIVPFIQSKYSFTERPQFGIVVKGSGGSGVALSADNFIGTVVSRVMLAYFDGPAYPLEWVREDTEVINRNNGLVPTEPGVYYLEVLSVPTNASEPGQFILDPLLDQTQEPVRVFTSGQEHEGQLSKVPVPRTLRLYANNYYMLEEGTEYTVDYSSGKINFSIILPPNSIVRASYRYIVPSIGPKDFYWNTADSTTLPGVVLAFGKRARQGDKVAIRVYETPVDTAEAYGGKYEYGFDLDIIATDPDQMKEMADFTVVQLWGVLRGELANEGIEILSVTPSGESEEARDETGDEYFYTAPVAVQMRTDWEIHVPMPLTISGGTAELTPVTSSLVLATAPIYAGRNNDFERIR